ncbi:MAG: RsmE family RNA methyltransferase [Acidobacteriia bacterium]|nr:RsmE family RNA methyltransferase [Terriglobia bacterium]
MSVDRRIFVAAADWSAEEVVVREDQAHHLKHVLRAQAGEVFEFVDGEGRWARAMIEEIPTRGEIHCRMQDQTFSARPPRNHFVLLPALIRFENFEWILEKAVELGVTRILPLITAHTEAKWRDISAARYERWDKIMVEAMKQCRRVHLPEIEKPSRFDQSVSTVEAEVKILCSEKPATPAFKEVCRDIRAGRSGGAKSEGVATVGIWIGPEGGWSEEEVAWATGHGLHAVSFGERTLRAETAALAALCLAQYEFDR